RAAIDPHIINKVLSIIQDNSVKLDQLSKHCAKLEYLIKEQQTQLGEQISDEQIKEQLKALLENNKECLEKLQKIKDKGVSFNKFWSENLYSEVLTIFAIWLKKGYYIRRVKEGLWSTFGVNRIKLFSKKDSKAQMLKWKKNSKKAYSDLYNPCDPDNLNSKTFLSLIIKYVFVSNDERTQANVVWTQAVLETVFDEKYLSPKIDADYVNT
ncbi:11238_t:CDS:2, partial [Dentiscutata heterogama]